MPKIKYQFQRFSGESMRIIAKANEIIADYASQGYDLTLRQLYYQFVARALIDNNEKSYKRLGQIVNDARLAGHIDWNAIVDRTRSLRAHNTWDHPKDVVAASAEQFTVDKWAGQETRVEVWIEKDALVGVFDRVCREWQLPLFSCRGYTSQSEMWVASQRLRSITRQGQAVSIIHFGDHDPSGLDMSRDILERLKLFGSDLDFTRAALNRDQVDEYDPPPNPAKVTDSRYLAYQVTYGNESWELDALNPATLSALVTDFVTAAIDKAAWSAANARESMGRAMLNEVVESWDAIMKEAKYPRWQ